MQKAKKKYLIFLVILFLGTTTGCRSNKAEKKALPPKPERQKIEAPQTLKDCAERINYYEHLVEEWEAWSVVVEDLYYLEN